LLDLDRCRSLAISLFDRHIAHAGDAADMALAYAHAARVCGSERYVGASGSTGFPKVARNATI